MAATGRVQRFLEEARVSLKRPAGVEQPEGVKRQACLLLPVTLQLDTGHRETPREVREGGPAQQQPAAAAAAAAATFVAALAHCSNPSPAHLTCSKCCGGSAMPRP